MQNSFTSMVASGLVASGHKVDINQSCEILVCNTNPSLPVFGKVTLISMYQPVLCLEKRLTLRVCLP